MKYEVAFMAGIYFLLSRRIFLCPLWQIRIFTFIKIYDLIQGVASTKINYRATIINFVSNI